MERKPRPDRNIKKSRNPFTGAAVRLAGRMGRRPLSAGQKQLEEDVAALAGGRKDAVFHFRVRLLANTMLLGSILLAVSLLVLALHLTAGKKPAPEKIARDTYGGTTGTTVLQAQLEGESEEQVHTVNVSPRRYSEKKVQELLAAAQEEFEEVFLGNNPSQDAVRTDLYFPAKLQEGQVDADYMTIPYGYIETDGRLRGEPDANGTIVEIRATLTCQDTSVMTQLAVKVLPPVLSHAETLFREVEDSLQRADRQQATQAELRLPTRVAGRKITWKYPPAGTYAFLLLLFPVILVFYYVHAQQTIHEKAVKRKEQLALDYSDLLWQIIMLLRAGMTMRGIFARIEEGYNKREPAGRKRYVYEEVRYTCRDLRNGVSEARAYEQFGQRCALLSYVKLGTLLSQNLRKGNAGLADLLEKEASDSMEERKNMARKQGEKAGTRLLFPMLLMLLTVLIVLMAPAFFSLR